MTDSDLRELDGWIAEKFLGWELIPNSNPPAWIAADKHIVTWDSTSFSDAFRPSTLLSAFALVKREIERRGWVWSLDYYSTTDDHYQFRLHSAGMEYPDVNVWAASEELAGCLAVKAAVEAVSSSIPTYPTTPSVQTRTMLD